uniref:legumain n=1 Tax=Bursaphelenchus xylophilus TaxID=6326 RepID=A0A1I7RQE4_BURXY
MWLSFLFVVCFASIVSSSVSPNFFQHPEDGGKIHAVIAAGSLGIGNYRHQADACHAYHVLRKHGVEEENIILMMADDVANDKKNPTPGKLYNNPARDTDVYEGCKVDYRGADVNPTTFMNVLTGNDVGEGPVLNSTEKDKVFVYFVDHGEDGVLVFQSNDTDNVLSVQDLNDTLSEMTRKGMYKELVFYVEACLSGSMFQPIAKNFENLYAITAANGEESSYPDYYVDDWNIYLGDEFSVAWMEYSDAHDLRHTTLQEQFAAVKARTYCSHVQQFGNLEIAGEDIGDFQGQADAAEVITAFNDSHMCNRTDPTLLQMQMKLTRLEKNSDSEELAQLRAEIADYMAYQQSTENELNSFIDKVATTEGLRALVTRPLPIVNLECHHKVVNYFSQNCRSITKSPRGLLFKIVNLCYAMSSDEIIEHMADHWQVQRDPFPY